MMKICFLGLSGSGKTCYLYAASHVLTEGIRTSDGAVSILSTTIPSNVILNKGIQDMINKDDSVWPAGSNETRIFPYDLYVEGKRKARFEVYDYRGGALYEDKDDAQDEREELYEVFQQSSCIVIFLDAYTLMTAFSLKNDTDASYAYKKGNIKEDSVIKAVNKLNHIKVVINEARERIQKDVPILLTITKKDILSDNELNIAIEKLKQNMAILFASENPNPIGITAVSLGKNLGAIDNNRGVKKRLTGSLHLDVSQNIHIPMLFPLFLGIDLSDKEKNIASKIFNNNVIQLYVRGKRAWIAF